MLMTAKQAQLQQLENAVVLDEETKSILVEIEKASKSHGAYQHTGRLQTTTVTTLLDLGYSVAEHKTDGEYVYDIAWNNAPVEEGYLNTTRFSGITEKFEESTKQHKGIVKAQRLIVILCIIIIVLLLLLSATGIVLIRTKQTGLVALIDVPANAYDIPDPDPDAITPPDDDRVTKLNEKLDKGKMCINMVSRVTVNDAYSAGYFNIVNDEANNYPQFVTITLDSNNTVVYQSGLIDVGKCIPYATLEVALPAGEYECTAVFTQVDTSSNKPCGQAAAKVKIIVQN